MLLTLKEKVVSASGMAHYEMSKTMICNRSIYIEMPEQGEVGRGYSALFSFGGLGYLKGYKQ